MMFGQALQYLLDANGLKPIHMAAALGYDVSYVNRWLNNIKLPSLKNNDTLFDSIAEYFTANCTQSSRLAMAALLGIDPAAATQNILPALLSKYLMETYMRQKYPPEQRTDTALPEESDANSSFFYYYDSAALRSDYTTAFSAAAKALRDGEDIECFSTVAIDLFGNSDIAYFNMVTDLLPAGRRMHIKNFVSLDLMEENLNAYCKYLLAFLAFRGPVYFDFYEAERTVFQRCVYFVVKNGLLSIINYNPFTGTMFTMSTRRGPIVADFYYAANRYIFGRRPLLERIQTADERLAYIMDFFCQSRGYCALLRAMPPVGMTPDDVHVLADQLPEGLPSQDIYTRICEFLNTGGKTLLFFKSAITEYIYYGTMDLLGQRVVVPAEQRKQHVLRLVDQFRNQPGLTVHIIEENNPILSDQDCTVNLYLSNKGLFAYTTDPQQPAVYYQGRSNRLLRELHLFTTKLATLPEEFRLSRQKALDFLGNQVGML